MTRAAFVVAVHELIARGLIVCTSGTPGDDDATYGAAWLPLDCPEQYPEFIRRLHADRMRKLLGGDP